MIINYLISSVKIIKPFPEILYDFSHQRRVETNRNDSERH